METLDLHAREYILEGLPVSPGIAIGKVYAYTRESEGVEPRHTSSVEVDNELERFQTAIALAERDLEKIIRLTREKLGADSAEIFEAQVMMLHDPEVKISVEKRISMDFYSADYAVHDVLSRHRQRLSASNNEYLRERAQDMFDIEERLLRHLRRGKVLSAVDEGAIVAASTLTAADVVLFSRRGIKAVLLQHGGTTSHVSIMARALGLPTVVGIRELTEVARHEDTVIVDGLRGRVIVRPTGETLRFYELRQRKRDKLVQEMAGQCAAPSVTLCGHSVRLRANLEFEEELSMLDTYGLSGVGLFRTELLMLMKRVLAISEDEQFNVYRRVVEHIGAPGVTFRVLDLGGDKMMPVANRELNPFLGWRGIRVLLDRPELLLPQVRALLRASTHGPVRLMLPMVTTLTEVRTFKQILAQAQQELRDEGQPYDEHIPLGIMVEVPAVALMADAFAREVDFFSIGSNDLTQYTLAVDRGNDKVGHLFDELHPGVLHLIQRTIEAAHRAGIPVSICGEMGGNPLAVPLLVGLGMDELSLSPVYAYDVKQIIRSSTYADLQHLAQQCLLAATTEEVRGLLRAYLRTHVPTLEHVFEPEPTS